jgi:hypothetical protein
MASPDAMVKLVVLPLTVKFVTCADVMLTATRKMMQRQNVANILIVRLSNVRDSVTYRRLQDGRFLTIVKKNLVDYHVQIRRLTPDKSSSFFNTVLRIQSVEVDSAG